MSINEIIEDFSELDATQIKLTLQIENTKLLYRELIFEYLNRLTSKSKLIFQQNKCRELRIEIIPI
jgi:hypothetical protein